MNAFGHLTKWLRNLAIKRLEATRKVYEQRTYYNMDKLLGVIQKGDVVFNIIGDRRFDYKSLWAEGGSEKNRQAA